MLKFGNPIKILSVYLQVRKLKLDGNRIFFSFYVIVDDKTNSEDQNKPGTPTSVQSDHSSASTPTPGVNRRTAVLFSKKGLKKEAVKDATNTTNTPPRKPGRPPKVKIQDKDKNASDSPQPPVLELMIPSPGKSPRSPGVRKRSASAIGMQNLDSVPSPPKRTMSVTEPLPSFSEPPDITRRDNFMTYRLGDHIRSSSESESTSGMSSSDESLSDSSSTGSSDSRSGKFLFIKSLVLTWS
jgi:hypothetical protein